MNNIRNEAITILNLTEENICTMQEYLSFLRKYTGESTGDLSKVIVKNDNEPVKSKTAILKYEMKEGEKGRIKLSSNNTKRLYEHFFDMAIKNKKKGNYFLLNFLTAAFFFNTDLEYSEQKTVEIRNQLVSNIKKLLETNDENAYKLLNSEKYFPDFVINKQNEKDWKLDNIKVAEKPIDIMITREWGVPGCDPVMLIINGDDLRKTISKNLESLIKISDLSNKEICTELNISESGLRHFIKNDSELSLSQAKKILELLPDKEDINITLNIFIELSHHYFKNQKYEARIEEKVKDYANAKKYLSKETEENCIKSLLADEVKKLYEKNIKNGLLFLDGLLPPDKYFLSDNNTTQNYYGKSKIKKTEKEYYFEGDHILSAKPVFLKEEDNSLLYQEFYENISSFLDKNKLTEKQKKELIQLIKHN